MSPETPHPQDASSVADGAPTRRSRRPSAAVVLAVLAVLVAATAAVFAGTGTSLAGSGVSASTAPRPRGVLRLDRRAQIPAAAIPTVPRARRALRIGGLRAQDVQLGCRPSCRPAPGS